MATTNRQQMVDNVRQFWIDGVLDNSLHGAVLMQLGLQSQSSAVHRPWDVKIRRGGQDRALGNETRIVDAFDYSGGTLLILGDPGSGKTTLLLELTRDLLDRAETQPDNRLPVVFNLSSWARDSYTLEEWLIEELHVKYQVARRVAESWVENQSLLLLLDGLDEVAEGVREQCVAEINSYYRQYPDVPMVVCSRTQDYDSLSQKLDFHDAVMIEPLDNAQIDAYLASFGEGMNGLRQQMTGDRRLRALAETPLTLSIMTLAYQGIDTATLPDDVSMDVQRKHLFDTYIETMFERHSKSKEHQPEHVMQYLSWLAGRMVERRQTLFHIENLQWDWLETRWQQSLFKLLGRTAYGAGIGAIAGGLAMLAGMILMAILIGQDIVFHQYPYRYEGLHAVGLYTLFGVLVGILAGGIPFGLTGLIAFTGERFSVKGQAKSYRARTAITSILISLFSSFIGGLILVVLALVIEGSDLTMYGRHFYEIGASSYRMEGLDAAIWFIEVSMLMGLVGGLVSVLIAGQWQKREGRTRQIVNGIAGLLVGGIYIASTYLIYFAYDFDEISELFIPMLIFSLLTGGIGILTGGFVDRIESVETIGWRWNWRWAKVGLAVAVVMIGLDYLANSYWYRGDALERALPLFLPVATLCVLVGGVAAGLRKNETVESRTLPNQGIRQSAKTALKITGSFAVVGVIIGLISMGAFYGGEFINNGFVFGELTEWEIDRLANSIRAMVILGVSSGLVVGLVLGGTDTVVKHLVLRVMLWRNADIPANYAKLLDDASSLILMRKVGGGYIFVHRYLLEHFAMMEE